MVRPKSQSITARMAEFLFHSKHRIRPLVMLTAYIDESGTQQGSKVLIVAAYIGTTDEWESAEMRFRKADNISGRIFHAVDCATGGKDFRNIHKDKRYRLYKKMVKIVNDHDIFGVGSAALIDDYHSVYPRGPKQNWEKWLRKAYEAAFQLTILDICDYSHKRYGNAPISFAVEQSEHWYTTAAATFLRAQNDPTFVHRHLLETIAPYSTEKARQLHAADLLAYETYLMKDREIRPTKYGPREHLIALLKKKKAGRIMNAWGFNEIRKADEIATAAAGV